jgi:hypothetical protein
MEAWKVDPSSLAALSQGLSPPAEGEKQLYSYFTTTHDSNQKKVGPGRHSSKTHVVFLLLSSKTTFLPRPAPLPLLPLPLPFLSYPSSLPL